MGFNQNLFGSTEFDSPGASSTPTPPPLVCPCNVVTFSASGGAVVGGSAAISGISFGGGVVVGGTAYVDIPVAVFDGMQLYYPLGDAGSPYAELVYGLDGTSTGTTAPSQVNGIFCRHAEGFGGSQYISLPQDHIRADQAFSVSLWATIGTSGIARTWYSRGFNSGTSINVVQFGYNFIRQLFAAVQLADGTTQYCQGTTILDKDHWTHCALSYEPVAGNIKVYVNGVLDSSAVAPSTPTATVTNGGFIGRLNTASSPISDCQDLKVYGTAKDAVWWMAEYLNYCMPSFVTQGAESSGGALLLESSGYLLLETGDHLLL